VAQGDDSRLTRAAEAFRQGNKDRARRLICAVLDDDPRNLAAWSWACEVATTSEERTHCLKQILAIDPSHEGARRYLVQLQDQKPAGSKGKRLGVASLLLTPLAWFFRVPPVALLVVAAALIVAGGFVYFRVNTDLFGLLAPDFDALTVSDSYERIDADGMYWTIAFEGKGTSEYGGVVRHVSPIREDRLPILTHDILVTYGDYADPGLVNVSVVRHHFRWSSSSEPNGRINLLHTVPISGEVYRQLLEIRVWDQVLITGREIRVIEAYYESGDFAGEWRDTGCNTLLVESVSIVAVE
jgi:hypothetical protein